MQFTGYTHKFGDNINTDVIIPARYLNTALDKELAAHCMEDIDRDFIKKVNTGDIIIAGSNFGCGSSREHAPIAIKACGISCVIAKSFARIFYRNAINIGLPILECSEAVDIEENSKITVDLKLGKIIDLNSGKIYKTQGFPGFIENIISNGGLINSIKKENLEI